MTQARPKPIARLPRGAIAALGVFALFYPTGFVLDRSDGVSVPVALGLAVLLACLVWRIAIGGVYSDGSVIVVVNLTRTVRVDVVDIVGFGPDPGLMGRLYLVTKPGQR